MNAINPTHAAAHAFIRWPGGKSNLLPKLLPLVPAKFGTYHEPFIGGGALFFALRPPRAVLSDRNAELVNCYTQVRDDVDSVIAALKEHRYDEAHYYGVRAQRPADLEPGARAARLIFLSKTCFNGVYRVNRNGEFNVPFGKHKTPVICDEPNLRACSEALQGATIHHASFEGVRERAVEGDFVYFDPPYLPISKTSSFTGYTRERFGRWEHQILRDVAATLARRGAHVLISNSAAPAAFELYEHDFEIIRVSASRSVGAQRTTRGRVEELIVRAMHARSDETGAPVASQPATEAEIATKGESAPKEEVAESTPPSGDSEREVELRGFPSGHPMGDEELRRRILVDIGFRSLAEIVRSGRMCICRCDGWPWAEVPYQLYIEGRAGVRAAAHGVFDVATAIVVDANSVAERIDVPTNCSLEAMLEWDMGKLRDPATNVAEYGARVLAIVNEELAGELERLQAEAVPLWAWARLEWRAST